jgi:hypothetical protein
MTCRCSSRPTSATALGFAVAAEQDEVSKALVLARIIELTYQ